MWTIRWDENQAASDSAEDVIEIINCIHCTYINRFPVIVQIESNSKDEILIGVGNEQYSIIDYFPVSQSYSMSPEGENEGDDIITFYLGDDESEFYIKDTIKYDTALKILKSFLTDNTLLTEINWVID